MKKIKYIIGAFLGLSSVGIIAPIAASCSTNKSISNSKFVEYDEKIKEAEKHLITEQSAIDLNSMFYQNVFNRSKNTEIIKLTRDDIANKIVVNQNNFIYEKIKENNLENSFKEEVINQVYESYLNELNELNRSGTNANHGSFFSKHYWKAVGRRICCGALFILSGLWWGVQLAPAIFEFIKTENYKELLKGFIGFQYDLSDFLYSLVVRVIIGTKKFKESTNCWWIFAIWQGKFNQPILFI